MIDCPHWFQTRPADGCCRLGMYGGEKISLGVCRQCIAAGKNNPEYAEKLFATFQVSHPPTKPRITGCC